MSGLRRLYAITLVAAGVFILSAPVFASRKATDLMSSALKQRAAGNIHEAISSFEYALENTSSPLQKNLARFMMGDCQIEAGRYADAARTFNQLLEAVSSPEEQAEAIYRLMQAESGLGNRKHAESLFVRMRKNHRSSPYYELGQAFMKSEGLRIEADEIADKPLEKARPASAASKVVVKSREQPHAKTVDTSTTVQVVEKTKKADKSERFEAPAKTADVAAEKTAVVNKPAEPVSQATPGRVKLSEETSRLLRSILLVETAEGKRKEELATKILSLQDSLKDGIDLPGMDKALFELAECTAAFGELLEACKTYDQLLANHPASSVIEKAYYEAIRLRAILGVHDAVVGWAKAFLAAFPASEYRARVRALVEFAQAGGRVDLGSLTAPVSAQAPSRDENAGDSSNAAANDSLNTDSEYAAASHKMKEGRYNLALIDFKRLSEKYSQAPQIWWDLSLVHVQLEDFRSAEKAIQRMIRLDPDNEDANSLLGYIHYRLENYEEAATAYEQAGEPEGRGVNFFDAKNASQRMKKTAGKRQAD